MVGQSYVVYRNIGTYKAMWLGGVITNVESHRLRFTYLYLYSCNGKPNIVGVAYLFYSRRGLLKRLSSTIIKAN